MKLWIARDKSGTLWLYDEKPIKFNDCWRAEGDYMMRLDWSLFPEVQWTDEEPTNAEFIINKD